jgi:hypothetical protein
MPPAVTGHETVQVCQGEMVILTMSCPWLCTIRCSHRCYHALFIFKPFMAFFDAWYRFYHVLPCCLGLSWCHLAGHLLDEHERCPWRLLCSPSLKRKQHWLMPHTLLGGAAWQDREPYGFVWNERAQKYPKTPCLSVSCSTLIIVFPAKNCCLGVSLSLSFGQTQMILLVLYPMFNDTSIPVKCLDEICTHVMLIKPLSTFHWFEVISSSIISLLAFYHPSPHKTFPKRLGDFRPSHLVKSPFPAASSCRVQAKGSMACCTALPAWVTPLATFLGAQSALESLWRWHPPSLVASKMFYPLVNIQKAIENGYYL